MKREPRLPLDIMPALDVARLMNAEDEKVAAAVNKALPQIALAIDLIAGALEGGGRLIYVGCGTSGRIAALDASEIPPTFNTDPKLVQYVIAGGDRALGMAAEYKEDKPALARQDLRARNVDSRDVVIGIAASGRTPYTLGALKYAASKGALTVAAVCKPESPMAKAADVAIVTEVGPEVISGSTRLKAGTAQKMVLNMLSTGAMIRLGRVYGNLMVNVHLKNKKLMERGLAILKRTTGANRIEAQRALKQAKNQTAVALVMLKSRVTAAEARQRLKSAKGNVRRAIEGAKASPPKEMGRKRQ